MISDLLGWTEYVPELAGGLGVALKLTAISLLLGYPLGLLLVLTTDSSSKPLRGIGFVIVEFGRGIPLLVLLLIVYQGLPQVELTPTAMISAIAAFTWSAAAYSTEIIRASLAAVPRGQSEAADAAGMSDRDRFRFIIFPQAARLAIPPLMNLAVQWFQFSSLAYVITVPEIMQAAYFQGTVTFDYLSVFIAAAFIYAAVTIPTSALVTRLEARLGRHL
jgi:polar amino acid transport system permease protein